ncbi:MAG: hypothetical protein RLZZ15_1187, partial [Verrucomicrobiota bacterium]
PPTLSLDGGGTLTLADATAVSLIPSVTLNSGTLLAPGSLGIGAFTQTGGSLVATTLLLSNHSTWSGGDWSTAAASTASIAPGGSLTLDASSVHDFNRRTITNHGTLDWQAGQLRTGNGGGFLNAADGTVLDSANSSFNGAYGGTVTFANLGLYAKTGPGTSAFGVPFTNAGTLNLSAGTLDLQAGGTFAAGSTIGVAAGATLRLSGGTLAVIDPTGLVAPTGNYVVTGGTLAINTPTLTLPNLSFANGTLNGTGALTVGALTLTSGTIVTPLTLTGASLWQSGNFNAPGTTLFDVNAVVTISTTSTHDFNQRALVNAGVVHWTGGQLRTGNGGSITNQAGAVLHDTASSIITNAFGGAALFTNHGLYEKSGSGITRIEIPFINAGTVAVSAGTLRFTSTFTQNGGTLALVSGGALQFDNGFNLAAGTLRGNGTINGNVVAGGIVSPGQSPGALTIAGNLTLQTTSQLIIELAGPAQGTDYDFLNVTGTATLGGTLALTFLNGYQTTVTGADTFTIISATNRTGAFSNALPDIFTPTRLFTTDNLGSFQVNYTGTSVTLSNFVPVPEPETWALLLGGLGVIALAAHRRRRG